MSNTPYTWHNNHLLCAIAATACLSAIGGLVAFAYVLVQLMAASSLFRALLLPLLFWLALYSVFRRPGSA